MSTTPLFTFGVPVFNEEKFIAETLDSCVKQTYRPLEIIIADNGSTDSTEAICRAYAQKHDCITYIRHPKNLGQHANFNYLPRSANGTYFCWASGHDLFAEDFAEVSVRALEENQHAVLAYPRTISMTGDKARTWEETRSFDIVTMNASQRFRETMWRVDCNVVYGVWRTIPMVESKLFQVIPALDRVFLAEMAVKGSFLPAQTTRYSRMNRERKQTEVEKRHRVMSYLFPHRTFTDAEVMAKDHYLPTLWGFYRVVQDAHFPFIVRWRLYLSSYLSGVFKMHLFPFADELSACVKFIFPSWALKKVMRFMQ